MKDLCSHEQLRRVLAGMLTPHEEAAMHQHLEHCESCAAAIEQLSGGAPALQEIAAMFGPDGLEDVPQREECSPVDFVVDHLEPADDPAVMGRLGAYDVHEVIGQGGMGVVLKGFDPELKRFVAIKALAPHLAHSELARKRFAREA
jgi:serine/threonine-protein kinase